MRPLSLGPPRRTEAVGKRLEWIEDSLTAVERASTEEDLAIADDYVVTAPASVSRTIDATSLTRLLLVPAINSQVGATAGWVITGVNDAIVRLPASQTSATLIIPITGLHIGETLSSVSVIGQVESAGGNVTCVLSVRKGVAVVGDFTDAELATGNVGTLTADTLLTQAGTPLQATGMTEVLAEGEFLYALLTATTAASTDIAIANLLVTYAGTVALVQASNVLAQLLTDMKARGPYRYEA